MRPIHCAGGDYLLSSHQYIFDTRFIPLNCAMPQKTEQSDSSRQTTVSSEPRRRRRRWRRVLIVIVATAILIAAGLYGYNNVSLMSDASFSRLIDAAIERSAQWVASHKSDIYQWNNIALTRMLQDCETMHSDPRIKEIVDYSLKLPMNPDCWKRLIEPDHFVRSYEINDLIEKEPIDNKWILYAIAPEKATLEKDAMNGLFDSRRWNNRQLTHQLWALIHLRRSQGDKEKTVAAIDGVSRRLAGQLQFDLAVVDIYIQKIVFTLFAGHPEYIHQRWIERVITAQRDDGGWNDRWGLFFQSRRRPAFDFANPASDQHATIQALWLLYQVKYRYADRYGVR
jgi:hypothetical protein